MDAIEKLSAVFEDPYCWAREAKEKGRKVLGVSPMYFPEELVHAGGALPVVLQESLEMVVDGYSHLFHFFCGFTRSVVDMGVRNELDFLDGIVVGDMCIQIRHMAKTLKKNLTDTPVIYMQWPGEAHDRYIAECTRRLEQCKEQLEGLLGKKIDEGALKNSVAVYNKHRQLLRKVYEIGKKTPGAIRPRELSAIVVSSMVMPKEEHNKIIEGLIPELEKRKAGSNGKVNLYLAGHLCISVKVDLLDLIEDVGGVVVCDDLYGGQRYIATDAPEDLPPLEAFAKRYHNQVVPCATRTESQGEEWSDYIINHAKESKAGGVIVLMVKQCGPLLLYYPYLRDCLDEAGVPHVLVITEHEMVSLEATRTKLQAFIEMIEKGG